MDSAIVITVLGLVILYLFSIALTLRFVRSEQYLLHHFRIWSSLSLLFLGIALWVQAMPLYLLTVLVLFTLLHAIYVLSVFSYAESSVTVKLFSLIAAAGAGGLSRAEIAKLYNSRAIITRRLQRLAVLNVIIFHNGNYVLNPNPWSLFLLRQRFQQWLGWLFSGIHTEKL